MACQRQGGNPQPLPLSPPFNRNADNSKYIWSCDKRGKGILEWFRRERKNVYICSCDYQVKSEEPDLEDPLDLGLTAAAPPQQEPSLDVPEIKTEVKENEIKEEVKSEEKRRPRKKRPLSSGPEENIYKKVRIY